jgi:lipoprotein NlpI
MRFSVLFAGLATLAAISGPVRADSRSDLDHCKFVGTISTADQSIASCDRAIQDPTVTGPSRAVAFSNRCGWWWAKKDPDRALPDCNEAIKIDPTYAAAYINRGNIYMNKRDFAHAFDDFNEAIRLNPKSAWAFTERGEVYKARGDLDHAMADFNEAIRLEPNYAAAYFARGDLYKHQGDLDRAATDLNESIRLNPDDARAYFVRGSLSYSRGDNLAALADFNSAIRLDPNNPFTYFNRGVAYFFIGGRSADAEADFKKATELNPADAYAALWLDLVARRNGAPGQLAEAAKKLNMTEWPAPIVRQFLGELTAAQTLAAAADANPKTQVAQTCEANFYSGEFALIKKNKPEALRLLKVASDQCPLGFTESTAAIAELLVKR